MGKEEGKEAVELDPVRKCIIAAKKKQREAEEDFENEIAPKEDGVTDQEKIDKIEDESRQKWKEIFDAIDEELKKCGEVEKEKESSLRQLREEDKAALVPDPPAKCIAV